MTYATAPLFADVASPARFGTSFGQFLDSLPGAGMPQDRLARIAARHAFVAMKRHFMDALTSVDGTRVDWLREHVRLAHQPIDLWLLRRSVFEQLRYAPDGQRLCAELDHELDALVPDATTQQMQLA